MPQTTEPDLPLYLACVAGRLSMATESPASSDMLALALAMLRLCPLSALVRANHMLTGVNPLLTIDS
jgi:hypothetical protein